MQLFRMREPNMRKQEYHSRIQQLQDIDLTHTYHTLKKSKVDGRDVSPEEVLRKILIEETSASPPKTTN